MHEQGDQIRRFFTCWAVFTMRSFFFLNFAEVAQISMAAFYTVQVSTQKWQGQILGHFVHKLVWSPWIHAMCCVVLCCVAKKLFFLRPTFNPTFEWPIGRS
jgi:hypothetical protein